MNNFKAFVLILTAAVLLMVNVIAIGIWIENASECKDDNQVAATAPISDVIFMRFNAHHT